MNIKLPNKIKKGLKVFGMVLGLSILAQSVDAILKSDLPKSTISDEFPVSYQRYINELKKVYPNAVFKAVYTGLNWDTVLKHESYDVNKRISTVPKSYSAAWKMNGENIKVDGSFVAASKSAVAYVLDPRNSLYEKRVFQFEGLTYNENVTPGVIEKVIVGSPMVGDYAKKYKNAGNWVDMDLTYAEIIDKVGKETKVSSVYIASRMIQETSGDIINNGSVNGSNSTYPGVYNFFNIGATPNMDGTGSVLNGLKHAKSQGWTTPYLSILGGVKKIKSTYIDYGQDTVYFQKFDVNNPYGNATSLMAYQFQTNILAPISESGISYNAYKKLDMLDTAFVFYIPVYNNMPEDPTPYPVGDNAKFEDDNTKVYLDDLSTNEEDVFNIRASANTEIDNVICKITEKSSNPDEKVIMTRVKKGNGYDWDKVEFELNGEKKSGYVWSEYVQVYEYTKVENITLDKEAAVLEVDSTLILTPTIAPDTARFKEVIWTSSNEDVLVVENGKITAKAPGQAVVTAITEDQGKTVLCTVTVKEKAHDITVDKEEYVLEAGTTITPNITLKNIADYELKVIDENIAKVVDKSIEAILPGETTIEIKGVDFELVKTVKLTVTEKEYKIETDKEEYTVEAESCIEPIVTLKNIEGYTLEIANPEIAIVEGKVIKGVKAGETIIKILGTGTDKVKEVKIVVTAKEYKIETDKEEYTVEAESCIEPIVTLKNIEGYTLESANPEIAIAEGKVIKGVKAGETIIKILGTGTDKVKEVKIVVTAKEYKIETDKEEYTIRANNTVEPIVNLKNIQEYTLESGNIEIAIVEGKVIKGVKAGETIIKILGTGTDKVKEVKIIVLPNESYTIDTSVIDTENILTNITTGTTIEKILSKISVEGLTIKVTNEAGVELAKDAIVGTGTKIAFIKEDGSIYAEKQVIIRGDATGDGVVNSADLLKIVKYLKNTTTINLKAADATKDGVVNSADLLKIVKHLKGTSLIDFK